MKSMFQIIAAAVCAVALTACGGGDKTPTGVVIPAQPEFKLTETKVGTVGEVAATNDTVVINLVGYLYDSTKADGKGVKVQSSVDTGAPYPAFTVGVGDRLVGWDRALLGMKAGGARTVVLPYGLAYGDRAVAAQDPVKGITYPVIPAYSALVYDLEMVSVTKAVNPPNVPPSGNLEITDTVPGTGDGAVAGKTLAVSYTLYLYDGTRANRRGLQIETATTAAPFSFVLGTGSVIAGWHQGLPGMKVGGKRTLQIPPGLGYGAVAQLDTATGAVKIPANSTLIFDLELVSIK